jgi:adenine-specific DNA-methyltransferase
MCDEIFFEENFIANLIWQKKFSRANDASYFSTMHDHILCYAKKSKINGDENGWEIKLLPRGDETPDGYSNPDNDIRGYWTSVVLSAKSGTEKLIYEITTPSGRKCLPPDGRFWGVNKEKFNQLIEDNRIWFGKGGDGIPRLKTFLSEVQNGLRPNSIWFHQEVGHNQEGRQEVKKMFNEKGYFDGPKPVRLLLRMLQISNLKENDIILDFFAGSGTTAQAVMQSKVEGQDNSKFIMVQLPERCDEKSEAYKSGYKTIAELTKERIRRAGAKIRAENPLFSGDTGFRVFKLDSSNIQTWSADAENLEETLFSHLEHVKKDRSETDILYEVLLKLGLDLCVPIEQRTIVGKAVHSIGAGSLLVCLAQTVSRDDVEPLAHGMTAWHRELKPVGETTVFFRDSAFVDDVAKTNLTAILHQHGIETVRSL